MAKCVVIADDLTGANATGVLLKKNGFETNTLLSAKKLDGFGLDGCDCLVIPTGSRAIPPADAYSAVAQALDAFMQDDVMLYAKRIDSTLRGNLGSETDAFLDRLGSDYLAVCVPCFPSSGRCLVGGYLLVNGVPLLHTEAAKDPKNPITTSSAKVLYLAQSKYPVATIHLDDIAAGPQSLSQLILKHKEAGARILICDSVTQEDMEIIAYALLIARVKFFPVDPGVFTATVAKRVLPHAPNVHGDKVLCAIGSVNGVARAQFKELLSDLPVHNVYVEISEVLESEAHCRREIERVVEAVLLKKNEFDLFSVVGCGIDPERRVPFEPYMEKRGMTMEELSGLINDAIAAIACAILTAEPSFKGLYSTGGDITGAINERMGTVGLKLMDEVVPLAGYGELIGGAFPGLKFISKGGMVGNEKAMVTCVRYLKEKI